MAKKAVMVKKLSYAYDEKRGQVLNNISFDLYPGEMVALVGGNGSGKSTLGLCLNGVIPHLYKGQMLGQVWIFGKNTQDYRVAELALEVGMVGQDADSQLIRPTVAEEIAFAMENICLPQLKMGEKVEKILDLLRITHLQNKNPHSLSGGEKHLVVLGAILALDPRVLVLDEVMSPLDECGRERVWQVLLTLQKAGKTIVVVEHEPEVWAKIPRLLNLEKGHLIKDGSP